jgi:hypothetical protein
MVQLQGSVGLHGLNRKVDVTHVQDTLRASGLSPGAIDGLCGRRTIGVIVAAQRRILAQPDGLVEVHWSYVALLARHAAPAPSRATPLIAPTAASPRRPAARTARAPVMPPTSSRGLRYTDRLPLPTRGLVNITVQSRCHRPPGDTTREFHAGLPAADQPSLQETGCDDRCRAVSCHRPASGGREPGGDLP